jgi:putative transposase
MARPPSINRISYTGRSTYLVTTATRDRVKAFIDLEFGHLSERVLLTIASREQFAIPAYCLMPDHAHFVATGLRPNSDLRRFVAAWKQATGFAWSKRGHGRLWQTGYWERLARFDEPIDDMVRYVIDNPVRAKLVATPALYPLTGSTQSTVEQICHSLSIRRH